MSASHFGGGDRAAAGNGASLQPPAADGSSSNNCDEAAPFTANLPLSGEPYHPLEFYPTSQIDLDWGSAATPDEPWAGGAERSRCFVILFGVGRAETEGIYSLRAVAKDDGLPVDTIVAFENEDDALRCAALRARAGGRHAWQNRVGGSAAAARPCLGRGAGSRATI